MLLNISHTTSYTYDAPIDYALQQLRLRPKETAGQRIVSWAIGIEGGKIETSFTDHHNNQVDLISFAPKTTYISVKCEGAIETVDKAGVVGNHAGFAPLSLFKRSTPLTRPGAELRKLAREVASHDEAPIPMLHRLNSAVLENLAYKKNQTSSSTKAEDALLQGEGVCQDHAQVFVSAARQIGFPARYVSGFLLLEDAIEQDAGHAWAEAYVDGIGWVGFDPPHEKCPDASYVRVATGLDSYDAAPIRGLVRGEVQEELVVNVQVQQ